MLDLETAKLMNVQLKAKSGNIWSCKLIQSGGEIGHVCHNNAPMVNPEHSSIQPQKLPVICKGLHFKVETTKRKTEAKKRGKGKRTDILHIRGSIFRQLTSKENALLIDINKKCQRSDLDPSESRTETVQAKDGIASYIDAKVRSQIDREDRNKLKKGQSLQRSISKKG